MKRVVINKHVILLYDSIEDMPIVNFQKYNKFLLIDSGIGSSLDDFDAHITRQFKYIKENKLKELTQELVNTRQLMYLINQEISPKYLAFAALIAEMDGQRVHDLSDDNLKNLLDKIRTVKHSFVIRMLAKIKKKLDAELNTYFPTMFSSAKEKEAYARLRERTILELEGIITGKEKTDKIAEIDDFLLGLHKPKSFSGKDSVEVKYDKAFENTCIALQFKLQIPNAKALTVLAFYNALYEMNKMLKAEENRRRK